MPTVARRLRPSDSLIGRRLPDYPWSGACSAMQVMSDRFVARGFRGRRQQGEAAGRVPPGQYVENGFPVLSAGPTPRTPLDRWDVSVEGRAERPRRWTWNEFRALPREPVTKDIRAMTKWSEMGPHWEG